MICNKGARPLKGERTVFLTNSAGKIGCPHAKELNQILTLYYSKYIKDLNVRSKTIKL